MNKILLIIQREYLTRVKKKSFIVMTILGPLLMASLILAPLIISKFDKDQTYTIKVIDQTPKIFTTILPSSEEITLINDSITLADAKKSFDPDKYYGILYLPSDFIKNPNSAVLYTEKQANIQVTQYIERVMKDEIEKGKLQAEGIKQETLESIKTDVNLKTFTLSGKENNALLTTAVGFAGGIAIYMFIFLYGVQVMRGVIEEKTNRIVEVIISSVKPFQLMMGKILGIALVGLTQFMLWIVLTFLISSTITTYIAKEKMDAKNVAMSLNTQQANGMDKLNSTKEIEKSAMESIMSNMDSINFPLVLTCFVIYFLGGYLLYSALFAAIGAAVDNETETQQFMLPVTIPLILSFVVAQSVITNPESQLSFWFSIIPLTSPVVMMVRVAFGVPAWQLILSISLLILGFIGTTWLAARIYRTGILLYGKKVNYKELSNGYSIKTNMATAVIDCGTNTFNLLIAEKTKNGFKSIAKAKRIVRLGSGGIDKKIIREDSIERAVNALVDFRTIISKHNVTSVKCVGTAAIRDASNSEAFLKTVYDATGFTVETIDGLQEAEYIYKGVLQAIKIEAGNSLIMDIGGGSVEFILFNSEKLIWKQSFRVGGARLMETFKPEDPISKEKTVEIITFIEDKLKELFEACKMHQPKKLIGSSGSFETFASLLVHQEGNPNYLRSKKHYRFTLSSYKKLHQQLVNSLYKERLVMPGMLKMRADMIVVASILLHTVLEKTQIKEFDLSTYALKEGLIAEEFDKLPSS